MQNCAKLILAQIHPFLSVPRHMTKNCSSFYLLIPNLGVATGVQPGEDVYQDAGEVE